MYEGVYKSNFNLCYLIVICDKWLLIEHKNPHAYEKYPFCVHVSVAIEA